MGCNVSNLSNSEKMDIKPRQAGQGAPGGSDTSLTNQDAEKASSSSTSPVSDTLTIIHFNDVYNIEEKKKEPIGGAARFKAKIDSLRELEPLILFSGDCLNPSNISVVTKGTQMVPVLRAIGVHCAVYGNHDFDFGVEHLTELASETGFPWLMSNARLHSTGRRLADGLEKLVIDWKGHKVGVMGLIEWEWIETLATLEPEDVDYEDFITVAKRLVPQLQQEGCDLIVALTHMRDPNDFKLAREVDGIDLIMGGHDHHYIIEKISDSTVLKSGSDFRDFSELTVTFHPDLRPTVEIKHHEICSDILPDPEVSKIVEKCLEDMKEGLKEEIGYTHCELEGRFCRLRTQECNLGNLITDIMRHSTRADIALLNSGTMRSDTIHDKGVFTMEDLLSILPMADSVSVLYVTGHQLIKALENGVSKYPKLEGRFPQVSGLKFTFDASKPPGSRVLPNSVIVGGKPCELNSSYKLVTKGYIAQGKDGYDVFKECEVFMKEDEGPILGNMVRRHFTACAKCSGSSDQIDGISTSSLNGHQRINPSVEGRITILDSNTS